MPQPSGEVTEPAILVLLDALYKRYQEVEHVATWGGSFEREHGARLELKPIVNKMFDELLKLLEARKGVKSKKDAQPSVSLSEKEQNVVSEKK